MTLFRYRAIGPDGETSEGEMEAADRAAVIASLQAAGQLPVRAEPVTAAPDAGAPLLAKLRALLARPVRLPGTGQGAGGRFAGSLATLLGAGLTLDRALAVLLETAEGEDRALARFLLDRVRGGAALSAAMQARDKSFSRYAIALVRAGEASGQLDQALARLARHEKQVRLLVETVRSALIYPAILLLVAALSIALLLIYVVPQFADLFAQAGRTLPLATRIVFATAEGLRHWGWLLTLLLVAAAVGGRLWLARPPARLGLHRLLLRLPLAGRLLADIEAERFARSLAGLVEAGVALPAALALASNAVGNRAVYHAAAGLASQVAEGGSLGRLLGGAGCFPTLLVQLVLVGEESGRLAAMLSEAADILAEESAGKVKRLVALIEPLLIVGLGFFVGGIMLSVLSAIVGLNALAL